MYACIINIYVPNYVKYQRAFAKSISQIMKYGQDVVIQNGKMYIIHIHIMHTFIHIFYPKWEVVLGAPDKVHIPSLMHDTRICQ